MQITRALRNTDAGYFIWYCPHCELTHPLWYTQGWTMTGVAECPTFTPSFLHTITRYPNYDSRGVGIGEKYKHICHYIVTDGVVNYCSDSTHFGRGRSIPLPDLPPHLRD